MGQGARACEDVYIYTVWIYIFIHSFINIYIGHTTPVGMGQGARACGDIHIYIQSGYMDIYICGYIYIYIYIYIYLFIFIFIYVCMCACMHIYM